MLDFMRRNAASWGIKIALGIISLVMVLFFGGAYRAGGGVKPLATVGEIAITRQDFDRERQRTEGYIRQQAGGKLTPEMLRGLDIPSMALSRLVDAAVIKVEAERLGLMVPDAAVKEAIQAIPAFSIDGQFSPTVYRNTLQRQGMSAPGFEASMREDLLTAQLTDIIRRGVHVTEGEAFAAYLQNNRKIVLSYVKIPSADLAATVTVDESGLQAYFDENSENFRRPESVKVRYIAYTPAEFADQVKVGDEEVEEYYALNENEFATEEAISARHILKKVPADADEETRAAARAKMEEVAKRIAGGEDFAEVAKTESEDTGSAVNGGDLGSFGRGRMVAPFEQAAFALEKGQVSDIVESPFGFHIIQVYDKTPAGTKSLDEVRDAIATKIRERDAIDLAFNAAAVDAAAILDGVSKFDEVAAKRGFTVQQTPPFSKGGVVPGIGASPEFVDTALEMGAVGDTSDSIKVGDSYYILELAERKDSYIPELSEVRDQAEKLYRAERATDAARAKADEVVAALHAGRSLDDVAAERGLTVEKTEPFDSRGEFIPGLGAIMGLKGVAFRTAKDGEPLPRPFVNRGDAYVFVRSGLEEGDRAGFDADKEQLMEQLRAEKEEEAVDNFLRQLKDKTQIAYDADQINVIFGGAAPKM